MRAFVIDDSRSIRSLLAKILKDLEIEVTQAVNGKDALDRLEEEEAAPDLIFVDLNMPTIDGFEFLKRVRQQDAYEETRIVVVTNETDMERIVNVLEAGADEYVMKPFTKDVIVDKLGLLGVSGS